MSDHPEVIFSNGIIGAIERGEDIEQYHHDFWVGAIDGKAVLKMDRMGLFVLANALYYASIYVKEKDLSNGESFDIYLQALRDYYGLKE